MSILSSPLPSSGLSGPLFSSPLQRRSRDRQDDPRDAYNARRRAADPLAMDDIPDGIGGAEAEEDVTNSNGTRLRRPKGRNQQLANEVPPVKDATGEAVVVHFEEFLSSWVAFASAHRDKCLITGFLSDTQKISLSLLRQAAMGTLQWKMQATVSTSAK